MRITTNKAPHNNAPIAMRDNTAKLNPTPSALHLMASGVVDQIKITETNATGNDIYFLQSTTKQQK
jgi:hypothetical protein